MNAVTVPTPVTLRAVFRPCTSDFNSPSAPTLTGTLQITDLPPPVIHKMRLKIGNLDGSALSSLGLRLVVNQDGSTFFEQDSGDYIGGSGGGGGGVQHVGQLTLAPFRYKLGQGWGVQIVPLLPDGSEGQPFALTEAISDASDQSDQSSDNSTIFPSFTELFAGQVLVHFPETATDPAPQFFPVHSGTATLTFTFTNVQGLTLVLPVVITNCSAGDCAPQLGRVHPEFDDLLMRFADRNGIPPQLLKAQIQQESAFKPDAFRYEPLSKDWKDYNSTGAVTAPGRLAPWLLAQSRGCTIDAGVAGNVPAGTGILLDGPDVTPRQRIYGVFLMNGLRFCRILRAPPHPNVRGIASTDAVLSMENILFTNDGCFFRRLCPGWTTINARSFDRFTDFQTNHPPFTGQTVIASSYGLHQLLYETAVGMGYQQSGLGRAPSQLFDQATSLDLGTEYLARLYASKGSPQKPDFDDPNAFVFQFGPSLRTFNGPPKLSFDQIFATCGDTPYVVHAGNPSPYDYPCLILQRYLNFVPSPLGVN